MDVSVIPNIIYTMKIISYNIAVKAESDAGAPYQFMQTFVWSGYATQVME